MRFLWPPTPTCPQPHTSRVSPAPHRLWVSPLQLWVSSPTPLVGLPTPPMGLPAPHQLWVPRPTVQQEEPVSPRPAVATSGYFWPSPSSGRGTNPEEPPAGGGRHWGPLRCHRCHPSNPPPPPQPPSFGVRKRGIRGGPEPGRRIPEPWLMAGHLPAPRGHGGHRGDPRPHSFGVAVCVPGRLFWGGDGN